MGSKEVPSAESLPAADGNARRCSASAAGTQAACTTCFGLRGSALKSAGWIAIAVIMTDGGPESINPKLGKGGGPPAGPPGLI
jgi:hypothetical protein